MEKLVYDTWHLLFLPLGEKPKIILIVIYASHTDTKGIRSKANHKTVYPNIQFPVKPVPHCKKCPMSKLPQMNRTLILQVRKNKTDFPGTTFEPSC